MKDSEAQDLEKDGEWSHLRHYRRFYDKKCSCFSFTYIKICYVDLLMRIPSPILTNELAFCGPTSKEI